MKIIHAVVVDASVFADYYFLYPRNPERHERARIVLNKLSDIGFSDRIMKNNALKSSVEAYYLLNDRDYKMLINKLIQ